MSWARVVSDIFSPPVVWGVFAVFIALLDAPTNQHAFLWASVYILMVCMLPVMYIAVMVKRGEITDIHMRVREQRIKPFLVSIACTILAWLTLRYLGAPRVVPLFVLFSLAQLLIMAVITLVWQISVHAICITGLSVATAAFFGWLPALLTLPLIPLVGAARLKLKRHTLAQVVAGSVVGAVVTGLLFMTLAT
ncbi:MAG: hypothetical protein OHK0046_19730 [Anaerolineae bacterium]